MEKWAGIVCIFLTERIPMEILLILEVSLHCFGISLFILLYCFLFLEIHSETEFWMPKEQGVLVINDMVSAAEVPSVRRDQGLPCDECNHFHFTGHSWAQQHLMITYFKNSKKHWTGRSLGGEGGGIVVNKSANNREGKEKRPQVVTL